MQEHVEPVSRATMLSGAGKTYSVWTVFTHVQVVAGEQKINILFPYGIPDTPEDR